jgi:hypothetical protein
MKEMIEINLDYWEKQLVLYTKLHYPRRNYKADLKFFPSKCYGLTLEQVDMSSMIHMVSNLFDKLVESELIRFEMGDFLEETLKFALWDNRKDITIWDILSGMLDDVSGIGVFNDKKEKIIDLGFPDAELFTEIKILTNRDITLKEH